MRHTGSKNKLARREMADLGHKTVGTKAHSNLIKRLNIIPGQHGTRRQRKGSDYGKQLREKQKLKRIYSISERQMRNYFKKASSTVGNTAEILVRLLEHRIDNVVYRLSLAPTRAASRQLVNHGHIALNGKKVSIPSAQVDEGDMIAFVNAKSAKIPYIAEIAEKDDIILPDWLKRTGFSGKIVGQLQKENFREDVDLQHVIEFYSR